ncbi:MAG: galactose-1-epimerase [Proteobacteria bacterium]|nr:MAG: galactose-1-epimerase [Pseudomonadota bacterium]
MRNVDQEPFGHAPDGTPIDLFVLDNDPGIEARITNFGGIVVALMVPDRRGKARDVSLGFTSPAEYARNKPHFGALIGRYANRIAGARFTLDGIAYPLAANNGPNHLHGGVTGFDKVVWQARALDATEPTLELNYRSRDGEEGYPGNLDVSVVYKLRDNGLHIDYTAVTDKPTPINLSNHTYFNLGATPHILDHEIRLNASRFLRIGAGLIPTGELSSVAGTPFDLRTPARIGARIGLDDDQLQAGLGYDHTFVIDKNEDELAVAAEVYDRSSGRAMRMWTTEPAVQFYSGNMLDGTIVGKTGSPYGPRAGLCLEAQHFPDSPNKPQFPSTILRPGEVYRQTTIYEFTAL